MTLEKATSGVQLPRPFRLGRTRYVIYILPLKAEVKHRVPCSPARDCPFELEITFCVRGAIGPPCGVPSSTGLTSPFSITPDSRMARISLSILLSLTRRAIAAISLSWFTRSKEATTHYPSSAPSGASDRHPCSPSVRRYVAQRSGIDASSRSIASRSDLARWQ